MNTKMLRLARKNYDHPDVPRHLARHNMRAWVRSIRHLGSSWLLHTHVKPGPSLNRTYNTQQ